MFSLVLKIFFSSKQKLEEVEEVSEFKQKLQYGSWEKMREINLKIKKLKNFDIVMMADEKRDDLDLE